MSLHWSDLRTRTRKESPLDDREAALFLAHCERASDWSGAGAKASSIDCRLLGPWFWRPCVSSSFLSSLIHFGHLGKDRPLPVMSSILPASLAPTTSHQSPRSPSPSPVPRINLFGVALPFNSSKSDAEPLLPSSAAAIAGPSTQRSNVSLTGTGFSSGGAKGLRRRRLVTQAIAIVGTMMLAGFWYGGVPDTAQWSLGRPNGLGKHACGHLLPESHSNHAEYPLGMDLETASDPTLSPVDTTKESQKIHHQHRPDPTPLTPLQSWGLDLRADRFLAGLEPWPSDTPTDADIEPLSSLGEVADEVYHLGHLGLANYTSQMEDFANVAFPKAVSEHLVTGMSDFLDGDGVEAAWDAHKRIWQTAKDATGGSGPQVKTWKQGQAISEGWKWQLLTDR